MSVWDVSTEVVYQVLEIVQAMTRFQWTAADLAVPVAVSLLLSGLWKADALGDIAARLSAWLMRGTLRVPVIVCIQIVIMTFIFFLDWTFDQEPPHVVYMRF
ncbi:MAG TPA: hypothetical protein VMR25_13070 [Planctomycetaceae bacterium]|nr:hypothetical protein [Planctomycetaceae bacterium]